MKFAEHLIAHITPEWRKQYIQYEEMKQMLYNATEQAPSLEMEEDLGVSSYYAKFDEKFLQFCDKELAKINTFYSEKLAESTRRYSNLKAELVASLEAAKEMSSGKKYKMGQLLQRKEGHVRKIGDMKLGFSEFYLSLILLQNYQNLNFTGFRKILKKHDKLLATASGLKWMKDKVQVAPFYTNKDIDKLIQETELTFTNDLEAGDRQKAMKRLRVPPLGDKQNLWTTFKVGLFSGAFIILMAAVVISAVANTSVDNWRVAFRLYRGPLLIVLFIFLIGINVYGWRSSGVNHVLIFELDPRNHLSEQDLIELSAMLGVLWCLSILTFFYSQALNIPPYVNPLLLLVLMILFIINPLKAFNHEARFWLLRVLGRVAGAPFFYVGFADFWLADQLNSLVTAIADFQYMICFYATNKGDFWIVQDQAHCISPKWFVRPITACLPAWFRFAQCLRRYRDTREGFPHLANAGKYCTTFFVAIFSNLYYLTKQDEDYPTSNPYFYIWMIASVISSLYAYTWDIKMDWGLFDKNDAENKFLREEIVYSSRGYYYFAIVEDFILRFVWILTVSLTEMGFAQGDIITTIAAPLEVIRRFVWNFFRLENEHLNNCGKFRAVRDISIAPIHDSDELQMLKMMDEDDGIVFRRKSKGKKKSGSETRVILESELNENDPYATVTSSPYNTVTSITSVKNWFANFKKQNLA